MFVCVYKKVVRYKSFIIYEHGGFDSEPKAPFCSLRNLLGSHNNICKYETHFFSNGKVTKNIIVIFPTSDYNSLSILFVFVYIHIYIIGQFCFKHLADAAIQGKQQ